jgi:hypothetical protein
MSVNRAPPPASVNLVLQHGGKPCKVSIALFVDYPYYSSTIRGLFVLFVDYSRTIRTIRRLFADYSHYSSTIRGLFVLFVDYSHYSLHYSSFINCPYVYIINFIFPAWRPVMNLRIIKNQFFPRKLARMTAKQNYAIFYGL